MMHQRADQKSPRETHLIGYARGRKTTMLPQNQWRFKESFSAGCRHRKGKRC